MASDVTRRGEVAGGEAVVVAGGPGPPVEVVRRLPEGAYVMAADSGLDHALRLGLRVDLVVGDMDSVSADGLATAATQGTLVERHPTAKDKTDLELALDRASAREPDRVTVVGGDGGRLDHLLATAGLLASARYTGSRVEAWLGRAFVAVVREEQPVTLQGRPGGLVTLLPVHGPARGVTTEGLVYPLSAEDLAPGTTRGVSNELAAPTCTVTLRAGTLLALQPDAL